MENCELTLETGSVEETQEWGARLARYLQGGDVLALSGDLGTGKTAFTQGLARGLGIVRPVTSPTFVLVNQYPAPGAPGPGRPGPSRPGPGRPGLQHVDCYRLANAPLEMWDVGLDDLLAGDDIVVIEWAERVPDLLPPDYLEVRFTYVDESRRRLCMIGHGQRWKDVMNDYAAGT